MDNANSLGAMQEPQAKPSQMTAHPLHSSQTWIPRTNGIRLQITNNARDLACKNAPIVAQL